MKNNGVRVLGIGDQPYDELKQELKNALTEYYKVSNLENYSEVYRGAAYFAWKYDRIDWIESNNEYWLEQDARLRTDFNVTTGLKSDAINAIKEKSEMKKYYAKGGIRTALLSYEQQQQVDRLAPTHIAVPTGSRIRVDYRQGAELPILRVRLQECFGMTDTPRVDDGKRPILMELLSPGFKPVQLTSDLHSFWTNTYFEVRKELRRRYPKHSWPDNPLEAEAVRGVKRNRE